MAEEVVQEQEFMYEVTVKVQEYAPSPREAANAAASDIREYLALGDLRMLVTNLETEEQVLIDIGE